MSTPAENPRPGAVLADVEIKAAAVGVQTGLFDRLYGARREPLFRPRHGVRLTDFPNILPIL
jgi:hypothetical protein